MANKITFIYDYKDGEVWSTPMSLVNEFKKRIWEVDIIKTNKDRKSTRLNSSHVSESRMPSSA